MPFGAGAGYLVASDPHLLEVDDIYMRFGGLEVLNGVSFHVNTGEIVALIGPNGAGKTTLFNIISGFLPPTSGSVRFDGKAVRGLRPHRIARLGLVRTFQTSRIFPSLNLVQNLLPGMLHRFRTGYFAGTVGLPGAVAEWNAANAEVERLIEEWELTAYRPRLGKELPYGVQRQAEIIRALAARPRLLMMDEPFAGINTTESQLLVKFIKQVRSAGVTVLLIDHNMKAIMELADRVVVLHNGHIIADDTPSSVRADKAVIEAYLGGMMFGAAG